VRSTAAQTIGDLSVTFACAVLIPKRGSVSEMSETVHQLREGGAGDRGPCGTRSA
jgi:hypothetical protein